MRGFWETIQMAMSLPYGKICAAGTILGPLATIAAVVFIKNQTIQMFVLMVAAFIAYTCVGRFSTYIQAIRTEDLKRSSTSAQKKKKKKR